MSIDIAENLQTIRTLIAKAATAASRSPDTVRLVAVSKTVGVPEVQAAYNAGQQGFGENRAQDLARKVPELPGDIEWHFIGRLQRNKVRAVVRSAVWIHSVDSVSLLQRIDRIAGEEGRRPTVLFEVNVSGETSKGGVPTVEAARLFEAAAVCRNLECRGLMTVAPFDASDAELHRVFGELRELRDRLSREFGLPLPDLSMGMSGDFGIAIAEGATIVRIGTAVFGSRCAVPV